MSNVTPLLERNQSFAAGGTDPAEFLGLKFAEAIVARVVGGRVNDAIVRDLSYIGYLVEKKAPEGPYFEAAIVHHTGCGSRLLGDSALRHGFAERSVPANVN